MRLLVSAFVRMLTITVVGRDVYSVMCVKCWGPIGLSNGYIAGRRLPCLGLFARVAVCKLPLG